MADTFQLEVVTPEKMVVKDAAEEAQIPGKNGYLGILPGHAPLITELAVGDLSVGKTMRKACGRRMNRYAWTSVMPTARAAARCP